MRAFISALIYYVGHAGQSGGHHDDQDDTGVFWRGCLRLPLCLTDSTFVVDNIRCQHSPPR